MNLLKTSFLSGIATIIKMLSNIVLNKIIAIYIGPTGIALIGQFQNVINMLMTLGSGGITTGVTKYVAEHSGNHKEKVRFIKAGLIITLICSLIMGIVIFILREWLSINVFSTLMYREIFVLLSLSIVFISLNSYLLALLNGLKLISIYILANIIASIFSLIMTSILTVYFGLFGAFTSMILVQALVLCITAIYFFKKKLINIIDYNTKIPSYIYKNFFQYSLMALVSMICVPITQILIRNMIIENVSLQAAGYWESINRISNMYLLVITTALTTYYLPRLSEIKSVKEMKMEVNNSYKIIIPFVLLSCLVIYFLKDFIIVLLFTEEFYEMRDLFAFQLIGDFFKMASWVLGFLMLARAMTKTFIVTEILSALIYLLLAKVFISYFSVMGATLAYAGMYSVYFVLMLYVYKNILARWDVQHNLSIGKE